MFDIFQANYSQVGNSKSWSAFWPPKVRTSGSQNFRFRSEGRTNTVFHCAPWSSDAATSIARDRPRRVNADPRPGFRASACGSTHRYLASPASGGQWMPRVPWRQGQPGCLVLPVADWEKNIILKYCSLCVGKWFYSALWIHSGWWTRMSTHLVKCL